MGGVGGGGLRCVWPGRVKGVIVVVNDFFDGGGGYFSINWQGILI